MYFSSFPIRTFPSQCNLSHVIGYLRQSKNGNIIHYIGVEKIYEETLVGMVIDAIQHFETFKPKGEFVMMVAKNDYQINN